MSFVFELHGNMYVVNGRISGVLPLGVAKSNWAIPTPLILISRKGRPLCRKMVESVFKLHVKYGSEKECSAVWVSVAQNQGGILPYIENILKFLRFAIH